MIINQNFKANNKFIRYFRVSGQQSWPRAEPARCFYAMLLLQRMSYLPKVMSFNLWGVTTASGVILEGYSFMVQRLCAKSIRLTVHTSVPDVPKPFHKKIVYRWREKESLGKWEKIKQNLLCLSRINDYWAGCAKGLIYCFSFWLPLILTRSVRLSSHRSLLTRYPLLSD